MQFRISRNGEHYQISYCNNFGSFYYALYFRNYLTLSSSSVSFCRKIVGELTSTLVWTRSAGQPDHVTVAAWPRFCCQSVSLSGFAADSGCVEHVEFFVWCARSWTLNASEAARNDTVVREGLMFYCCFFILFSLRDLRDPWADLREILPRVRKHVHLQMPVQKFKGLPRKKFLGRTTR